VVALEGASQADGLGSCHDHILNVPTIPSGFIPEVGEIVEDFVGRAVDGDVVMGPDHIRLSAPLAVYGILSLPL
jgi:hypothetical protein